MAKDNKKGLPTKDQLQTMMQRYASVQITPLDNSQDPVTISSDTSDFKKPIFFNTDCGKTLSKIKMAIREQGYFPIEDEKEISRLVLDGNLDLINKTMEEYKKLLGDDPKKPRKPFDEHVDLLEGDSIPEYDLIEKMEDEK